MEDLVKRYGYRCRHGYDVYGGCYSAWDSWARWVVLAVVIIGALIIFFLFSCISARRRRRMGYAPYRGTGWAAPPRPEQYGSAPYYGSNNYAQPPPAYGASQGYYGNQRDVEMQPPNDYQPPAGPPPAKIR